MIVLLINNKQHTAVEMNFKQNRIKSSLNLVAKN